MEGEYLRFRNLVVMSWLNLNVQKRKCRIHVRQNSVSFNALCTEVFEWMMNQTVNAKKF